MLILSLDCAGNGCGVCVWRDGSVIAAAEERMERGQDQHLMPMILKIMQQTKTNFDQLDRIAVTRGPGSFTGLRIGLAAARGIGLASNTPVLGVDRFSIHQEHFKNIGKNHLVVINSRRQELYCRYYPVHEAPHDATIMTGEEIALFLKNRNDFIVSGDIPAEMFSGYRSFIEPEYVTAARLAANADPNTTDHLPRPLYLRAPDVTMSKKSTDILRPLTLDMVSALAILHAESFADAKWDVQQIKGSLALDTTKGWGVYESDTIVGFILCQIIPDQSEILTLCVNSKYRKQGYGEKLVRAAIEDARQMNSSIHLEVSADNAAALALYTKLGFEQTGKRPNYYRHGTTCVDAIMLTFLHTKT